MSAVKINHIALVAPKMNEALGFWRDTLGLPLKHIGLNDEEAVEAAFLPLANGAIELIVPTTPDSGVKKYLDKRGAGMHHICLEVDNLDETLRHLAMRGINLINETARSHEDGTRYAFVHPKSTGGVLLELYELSE